MLKETSKSICKPLCIIFNRSIQECSYPNCLKLANVMPLFKKGNRDVASNYRPISLISCVGKAMERVVFKHLYNYLHAHNLIYKNQSGFLPGHSTVFQLIDIYHQICKAFDDKQSTCIVFCDISKAFDRVWHAGLLHKLRQYGITGKLNDWIRSYLCNRMQRVFVGSSFSKTRYLNAGVPQGSVLGPLLFLLYVNDISETLISTTRLFADDSSLSVSSSDINIIETSLNSDLQKLSAWSKQWLVNFNPLKTEVVLFSLTERDSPNLVFDGIDLSLIRHHKHLGITFSKDGSWHEHISNIITSASKILGSMQMLKFRLKRSTLNQIYITYLRPLLEYASVVWDNCTLSEKESLDKIQYEAARIVTGLTRSVSNDKLIQEIGWVSLSERRKMQKLILVYKYKQGLLPTYLSQIFPDSVAQTNPYNLRNNYDFTIVRRRTEIFSKSVIPSSVHLWNQLDASIRDAPTLSIFKAMLKLQNKPRPVPNYFLSGDRIFSIYHARIRNQCSNLNADLFRNHLRPSAPCEYGEDYEDAEHYFFFKCKRFVLQRRELFFNTRIYHPLSANKLLFGNEYLTDEENEHLFMMTQKFIKHSERFR